MIFVDSNIIIDILEPDPVWASWSSERLAKSGAHDRVFASAVVVAECAGRFADLDDLTKRFHAMDVIIEDVPLQAMFVAGQVFRRYRRESERRDRVLADFLIGAHAAYRDAPLITRDSRLYRRYFPTLTLITPETDHG
ncbi:MAG: type II toxin-antitoxin system VapC family toxin [Sphingomonas sp.]|nr:type II toxin-antitoxin system VapC family toxin [Sphingomonas sp.]